jgi:hypothetical protein
MFDVDRPGIGPFGDHRGQTSGGAIVDPGQAQGSLELLAHGLEAEGEHLAVGL